MQDASLAAATKRWLVRCDHRAVGASYLWLAFAMFVVGGAMALMVRAELFAPGLQYLEPAGYQRMAAGHGLVMVFGALMPAVVGLASRMLPDMLGTRDFAFPRLNRLALWMLAIAVVLVLIASVFSASLDVPVWPLGEASLGGSLTALGMAVLCVSLTLASVNIVSTVLRASSRGMAWAGMPVFVWSWLVTACLLLIALPAVLAALSMLLVGVRLEMLWMLGQPLAFVLLLPAFGIVSEILPQYAGKPLFGRAGVVYALISLGTLTVLIFALRVLPVGAGVTGELYFLYATMLLAVPVGVLLFSWVATMWRGAMTFETPMLYATAFVALFGISAFSGLMLAVSPGGYPYHGTYFVVGQMHYAIVGGGVFAIIAAVYHWLPNWCGRAYDESFGKLQFWLALIGANLTFFPQLIAGLVGMVRRVPDYALSFADFNLLSSVGAFVFGFAQLLLLFVVVKTIFSGEPIAAAER